MKEKIRREIDLFFLPKEYKKYGWGKREIFKRKLMSEIRKKENL